MKTSLIKYGSLLILIVVSLLVPRALEAQSIGFKCQAIGWTTSNPTLYRAGLALLRNPSRRLRIRRARSNNARFAAQSSARSGLRDVGLRQ